MCCSTMILGVCNLVRLLYFLCYKSVARKWIVNTSGNRLTCILLTKVHKTSFVKMNRALSMFRDRAQAYLQIYYTTLLVLEVLYSSIILCVRHRLLLFSWQNSGINTPPFCMYMFRLIASIIRYIDLLQSSFLLSAISPHIGQCLHIWRALYMYVVM
jgi:hypothetical protein